VRGARLWHEPTVPATARVGPEVGVELPMARAGHRLSAMEGRPSAAGKLSSRQPVTHCDIAHQICCDAQQGSATGVLQ